MLRYLFAVAILVITATASAQQPDRVRQLEQDVNLLKRTVSEQAMRIERLEREVRGPSSGTDAGGAAPSQPRIAISLTPWHDRKSWGSVKNGMSEAQVMTILGRPTSAEAVGDSIKTLFYRGEVPGSGSVSGNIKLHDDRVWQVNIPVF